MDPAFPQEASVWPQAVSSNVVRFCGSCNLSSDGVLVRPLCEANASPHLSLAPCICSQLVKTLEQRRGVISTPRSPPLVCYPKPLDKLTQAIQWGAQRDRPPACAGLHLGPQPSHSWRVLLKECFGMVAVQCSGWRVTLLISEVGAGRDPGLRDFPEQ